MSSSYNIHLLLEGDTPWISTLPFLRSSDLGGTHTTGSLGPQSFGFSLELHSQLSWPFNFQVEVPGTSQSITHNKYLTLSVYIYMVKVQATQLCPTLCDHMDYTVHGILQARILEWVAIPFFHGICPMQGLDPRLLHCRRILYQLSHKGSPRILEWVAYPFSRDLPDPGIKPGSPALQVDGLPTELSGKPHIYGHI